MVADESDNHNILWSVLSYLFFIVGLVLTIVWWKNRNTNAKAALYGTACSVVVFVISKVLKAVLFSNSFNPVGYFIGAFLVFMVGLVAAIILGKRANDA